jgi:Na+-transporting NADH:ubiquinone oxidoreductase subunit NqrD
MEVAMDKNGNQSQSFSDIVKQAFKWAGAFAIIGLVILAGLIAIFIIGFIIWDMNI